MEDPFVSTMSGSVKLGGQEHYYLEPHSAVAVPHGEKDEMTVHITTQGPSVVQTQVYSPRFVM